MLTDAGAAGAWALRLRHGDREPWEEASPCGSHLFSLSEPWEEAEPKLRVCLGSPWLSRCRSAAAAAARGNRLLQGLQEQQEETHARRMAVFMAILKGIGEASVKRGEVQLVQQAGKMGCGRHAWVRDVGG